MIQRLCGQALRARCDVPPHRPGSLCFHDLDNRQRSSPEGGYDFGWRFVRIVDCLSFKSTFSNPFWYARMPMPHKCLIRPRSEIAKRVLEDNILSADDV